MRNGVLFIMSFIDGSEPAVGKTVFNPDHLHVTLLPESAIPEGMLKTFASKLHSYASTASAFTIKEESTAVYGDNVRSVPVTLLERNEQIQNMHNDLLSLLLSCGGSPVKPFVGKNFSPHLSFNNFVSGKEHCIESFSLIYHQGGLGVDVYNVGNFKFAV